MALFLFLLNINQKFTGFIVNKYFDFYTLFLDFLKFRYSSSDTNDAVIDEADDQVTWQANGNTVTIDFDTDITASNVTIE